MIIYLYLKTHNKTGLKYLGKTVSEDPHKYSGSGKRWLRHLNKHGYDYTTEILAKCETNEELKRLGLYYSEKFNIVEDKNFANIVPEEGDGGATRGCGWKHTESTKQKLRSPKTDVSKMIEAQNRPEQKKLLSEITKKWHQDEKNYSRKLKQLKEIDTPECRKRKSIKMSSKKWCNDGERNYRLEEVPEGFYLGRLRSFK